MRCGIRQVIVCLLVLGLIQITAMTVPNAPPLAHVAGTSTSRALPLTPLQPKPSSSLPRSKAPDYSDYLTGIEQKVHPNLEAWMRTGIVPANLRARDGMPSILLWLNESADWSLIQSSIALSSCYTLEGGAIVQGFAESPKVLSKLVESLGVLFVMGDQRIESGADDTPYSPIDLLTPPHILGEESISLDRVRKTYPDFNGSGITLGVADTGVDFGVSDLAATYAVNASGYPTSYDPGGTGLAITNYSLPARRPGGGAGDYLLTAGLDFYMFRGDDGAFRWSSVYGVVPQDMKVGGYGGIVSQSGYYQVGMSVQITDGLPLGRALFIYILVDETTAGVYDTLYIDFETSWALTAAYNNLSTWVMADWDFTNNDPHRWGDGTEVLAGDFDLDGVNDFSMGMLSTTYDYFDILTGGLVSGILADGSGFALMNDPDGHGTSVAATVAAQGQQALNLYGNGTLETLQGIAPGTKIMALKVFTFGDYMNTWFWGCGYRPVTPPYHWFSTWTYTGEHKADILCNSWGYTNFDMTGPNPVAWGYDWQSWAIDFLSWKTDTLFCVATGNAGPGYGTGGSPCAVSALKIGATNSWQTWQGMYANLTNSLEVAACSSSSGPTPLGYGSPDVVGPGDTASALAPVSTGRGDGLNASNLLGGSGKATAITAGIAAIVMQAARYRGIIPFNASIAKTIVMNGADDLGYDIYRQGAGCVNSWRAINLAFGNATDGANELIWLGTTVTFDEICGVYSNTLNRRRPARAFNNAIWRGATYNVGPFNQAQQYHPGYAAYPAGIWDGAAFAVPVYQGNGTFFNVTARAGPGAFDGIESLTACTYSLWTEASQMLSCVASYTTFNLTAHFGASFMDQFLGADYAVIHLTYPRNALEELYALAGEANDVFLLDWTDINANGVIDLAGQVALEESSSVGADTNNGNAQQVVLGFPGIHFNATPAILYHDRGHEAGLWTTLTVNVTIRLYSRTPWTWITTHQYSDAESLRSPFEWSVNISVPSFAMPGVYEGYLEAVNGTGRTCMPLSLRVDAFVSGPGPGGAVTWGGSQDTPYDNGATCGCVNYGGSKSSGDWRFYFLDGYPFTGPPSYIMVNVTWTDPDTRLDVYVWLSWYGYMVAESDFKYVDGRWQGDSTWNCQNVLLIPVGDTGGFSWLVYSAIGIAVRTGAFGGQTGCPEDFWVTVSYGYENHPDDPPTWDTPAVWLNVTNPASYLGAAIQKNTTYLGPHVMFRTNWSELVIPEFPSIHIRQTRLDILTIVQQVHYGTIYGPVVGGWHPDLNPREAYDYVFCEKGEHVYVELEFGTWVDPDDPTKGLTHGGSDDIDMMIWAPGVEQVYANSLTGSYCATCVNPEIGTFIAPVTGNYTIGIDYYSGVVPMGWRCYVYKYHADSVASDGRAALFDTHSLDANLQVDVRAVFLTGTSLDVDMAFCCHIIPLVTVVNFFAPTVGMVRPIGGETFSMVGPIVIQWNGSDVNTEEVLHYSVEVSNDTGLTWRLVVNDTTEETLFWNASSDFALRNLGYVYRVRVTATDGKFTATAVSDLFELVAPIDHPLPDYRWLLIIAAIVIVGIDLAFAAYRFLRRRKELSPPKKLSHT